MIAGGGRPRVGSESPGWAVGEAGGVSPRTATPDPVSPLDLHLAGRRRNRAPPPFAGGDPAVGTQWHSRRGPVPGAMSGLRRPPPSRTRWPSVTDSESSNIRLFRLLASGPAREARISSRWISSGIRSSSARASGATSRRCCRWRWPRTSIRSATSPRRRRSPARPGAARSWWPARRACSRACPSPSGWPTSSSCWRTGGRSGATAIASSRGRSSRGWPARCGRC